MHHLPVRRLGRLPAFVLLLTAMLVLGALSVAHTSARAASTAATTGVATQLARAQSYALNAEETTLLRGVNRYRRNHHRSTLVADKRLDRAAQWMAADLGKRNQAVLSHTDSLGRFVGARLHAFKYPTSRCTAKEDLAAGQQAPADVLKQWKGSTAHRRNLLARGMHAVGLAQVNVDGSRYGWYWVIDIGSCVSKRL